MRTLPRHDFAMATQVQLPAWAIGSNHIAKSGLRMDQSDREMLSIELTNLQGQDDTHHEVSSDDAGEMRETLDKRLSRIHRRQANQSSRNEQSSGDGS